MFSVSTPSPFDGTLERWRAAIRVARPEVLVGSELVPKHGYSGIELALEERAVVTQARTFENVLRDVANVVEFEVRTDRVVRVGPQLIREWHSGDAELQRYLVRIASPVVPELLHSETVASLESLLDQHIVDGQIGNGFAYFLGGPTIMGAATLARKSAKAVAILGPERVAQLLRCWSNNERVPYRKHIVLSGATIDERFFVDGGVVVDRLPDTAAGVAARMPDLSNHFGQLEWTNAVVLSIDCEGWPAFCRPNETEQGRSSAIGGIWIETPERFGAALSLAADHAISCNIAWSESKDAEAFDLISGGSMFSLQARRRPVVNLTKEHLEVAMDLSRRQFNDWTMSRKVAIAVSRWVRSKGHGSLTDQLIDLRIALEALFVPDGSNQELRFRLALHGAWFLGSDFKDRKRIFGTLRDVYDLTSKAVHAGEVNLKASNQTLTEEGQSLCRAAILKRLDQTEEPDWEDTILGQ